MSLKYEKYLSFGKKYGSNWTEKLVKILASKHVIYKRKNPNGKLMYENMSEKIN